MNKPSLSDFISHYRTIDENLIKQICVIDFDAKSSNIKEFFKGLNKTNDVIVDVQKERWFNKSLAINIGASLVSGENIIICDADVLIQQETLEAWADIISTTQKVISLEYVLETLDMEKRPAPGICCLKKSTFLNVEGYCSDYIGWGFEDHDFLFRLQKSEFQVCLNGWGHHLTHDDYERTRNYYSQNKTEMRSRNLAFFKTRCDSPDSCGTYYSDIASCNISEVSRTYFIVSRCIRI